MLWVRTSKNQRLFHIKRRSKHWQVYFKVLHESVPQLDDQTPPQIRAEVNFVFQMTFLWKLWQVLVMLMLLILTSLVFLKLYYCTSPLLELLQTWSCRHQPGTALGRVWRRVWISPSHPCSQVTHLKSPENKAKVRLGLMGWKSWKIRPELMTPMLRWVISGYFA